jgi:hypothetical protein
MRRRLRLRGCVRRPRSERIVIREATRSGGARLTLTMKVLRFALLAALLGCPGRARATDAAAARTAAEGPSHFTTGRTPSTSLAMARRPRSFSHGEATSTRTAIAPWPSTFAHDRTSTIAFRTGKSFRASAARTSRNRGKKFLEQPRVPIARSAICASSSIAAHPLSWLSRAESSGSRTRILPQLTSTTTGRRETPTNGLAGRRTRSNFIYRVEGQLRWTIWKRRD